MNPRPFRVLVAASIVILLALCGLLAFDHFRGAAKMTSVSQYTIPGAEDAGTFEAYSNTVAAFEATTRAHYGDLATVGPIVKLDVPASGRVLVILSGRIGWTDQTAGGGTMTVQLSGANRVTASDKSRPILTQFESLAKGMTSTSIDRGQVAYVYEGLKPGVTTFTVKYKASTNGSQIDFEDRTLVLIPLKAQPSA